MRGKGENPAPVGASSKRDNKPCFCKSRGREIPRLLQKNKQVKGSGEEKLGDLWGWTKRIECGQMRSQDSNSTLLLKTDPGSSIRAVGTSREGKGYTVNRGLAGRKEKKWKRLVKEVQQQQPPQLQRGGNRCCCGAGESAVSHTTGEEKVG